MPINGLLLVSSAILLALLVIVISWAKALKRSTIKGKKMPAWLARIYNSWFPLNIQSTETIRAVSFDGGQTWFAIQDQLVGKDEVGESLEPIENVHPAFSDHYEALRRVMGNFERLRVLPRGQNGEIWVSADQERREEEDVIVRTIKIKRVVSRERNTKNLKKKS